MVERWYATGAYAWLQPRLTGLTNHLPWSALDVVIVSALLAMGFAASRWFAAPGARTRAMSRVARIGRLCLGALTVGASAYLVFLGCWGFNYRRLPVEARVGFDARRVNTARVVTLAESATRHVNTLHGAAHARPWPHLEALPAQFGPALERVARRLDLGWTPVAGRPKPTLLASYFRWAGIAGMTNPFGLDVMPGPDTLPFERHAVMAHEWAHLAGFAHEAEAGFVGWLTCLEGDDQARYSGWLEVWSSLVSAVPRGDRRRLLASLEAGPRRDLELMARRNARAVPAVRTMAWTGYDAYLRSQHVPEGVASYQGVVRLMAGTSWPVPDASPSTAVP